MLNVQLKKIQKQKEIKKQYMGKKITLAYKKTQHLLMRSPLKAELYRKLLKKHVDIYTSTELGISNTSTESYLYQDVYKLSKINHLTKTYGKGNSKHIHAFVKISKIKLSQCGKNVTNYPTLKESKLFNTTNFLIDNGILNSFVYCFNNLLLNKNFANFEGNTYAVLITEDISKDYKELISYIGSHTTIPECVLFELIYTLNTLNHIKMKHMDLHGANIFIKTLLKSEHKMIKYEVIINNKLQMFYVQQHMLLK